jgi:tetratricopeptide (TPR) repeat protein
MSSLVEQLNTLIQQADWPTEHRMTMQSRRTYESGLDAVNAYRGHLSVFVEALKRFQATYSCPYAYAGIAYTLTSAAAHEDTPAAMRRGWQKALTWLEKSQNLEDDRPEINFIEAVIYIHQAQYQNARLVLDHLYNQDTQNYYLCLAEMKYWEKQGDDQRYRQWFNRAAKAASTKGRQAFILNSLAHIFQKKGVYDKSLKLYRDVTELDPADPWAWHNMSVMLVRLKQFKEAKLCNERALKIMDFGAAREIEQEIKKNIGGLGRLFGR